MRSSLLNKMVEEKIITQESLGALAPSEIELLHLIRTKYRYGKLEIEVRDGFPTFIQKTVEREKLG